MIADHSANQTKAQPELVALFVSDTHLNTTLPLTTAAFLSFLDKQATQAKSLYLLGDLFEYWVGDDNINDSYNLPIVQALRKVRDHGVQLYWIAGNRDFLIGADFSAATGAILLNDPSVIDLAGKKIVLSHGDAQCTDDHAYMKFRAQVRQAEWQTTFLAMPLEQRKKIIEGLRTESKMEQKQKSVAIMDVNADAIAALFLQTGSSTMIHGHTHRPAIHTNNGQTRHVLPDWDCDCDDQTKRGGWLAAYSDGNIQAYNWDGNLK
ncbi:UDP-2,3-diacylglucosamine diphosphatase [Undibacterium umbellatum]|uniref:UDP-2,3-diacylglucosamine hydrolase n=1 Tax=Undibacterium umbellatum TaxID=2762300 RepID=A0ABR6Z501_9BURK|nr:UDP-2,3-diacylglucosamine diphosphatase [Undibacterium umbellatum]MBC3906406.1 UDP-2,3-diacylglucosamine diphosphatase [Undibacterium umbellatum]